MWCRLIDRIGEVTEPGRGLADHRPPLRVSFLISSEAKIAFGEVRSLKQPGMSGDSMRIGIEAAPSAGFTVLQTSMSDT
jgi:hypothetical protein